MRLEDILPYSFELPYGYSLETGVQGQVLSVNLVRDQSLEVMFEVGPRRLSVVSRDFLLRINRERRDFALRLEWGPG